MDAATHENLKNTATDPDSVKKRKIALLISIPLFLFAILALVVLLTKKPSGSPSDDYQKQWVEVKNQRFMVEIADDMAERARGLMNRRQLSKEAGMLFVFENSSAHSFWMYKTLIPLDIIWVSQDYKIVYIKKDAQPCESKEKCSQVVPDSPAKYVIEVSSGLSERYGFEVGDQVRFSPEVAKKVS